MVLQQNPAGGRNVEMELPPSTLPENFQLPEVFKKELENRGGLLTEANFSDPVSLQRYQKWYEKISWQLWWSGKTLYSKPQTIILAIYKGKKAEAFCWRSKEFPDFDFIGVSEQSYIEYERIFFEILSNPKTFSEIGNISLEVGSRYPNCIPICLVRKNFAEILTDLAIIFLVFHEVAHLKNGHVDYILEQGSLENPIKQTLEMDADSSAAMNLLNYCLIQKRQLAKSPVNFTNFAEDIAKQSIFLDARSILRHCIFATCTVFRHFPRVQWNADFFDKKGHPLAVVRQECIANVYSVQLLKGPIEDYTVDDAGKDFADALCDVEKNCAITIGQEPNYSFFNSIFDPSVNFKYQKELDMKEEIWRKILGQLKKYRRGHKLFGE